MKIVRQLSLYSLPAFILGLLVAFSYFHLQAHVSKRDVALNCAWNQLTETRAMCQAIHEGRPLHVIGILESMADGSIVGIGGWIGTHPDTIDKHDFMTSLRQYADYRRKFPRPDGLPPRSADTDIIISQLLTDNNENK